MRYWTLEEQAAHRAEWVEALESDLYPQAKHLLHSNDGYCCLGVACDLFGSNVKLDVIGDGYGTFSYNTQTETLPIEMVRYLGLVSRNGFISDATCLAARNDKGDTFRTIARYIRDGEVPFFLGDAVYLERYKLLREYIEQHKDTGIVSAFDDGMLQLAETKGNSACRAYFALEYYRTNILYKMEWLDELIKEIEGRVKCEPSQSA